MGSLVKKQAERFLREKKRHRRWLAMFLCLALLVSSGTFAALRMNGRAMDAEGKVLDCRLQVHEHTADCYNGKQELVCGQADYVVHTHDAGCYDKDGTLLCKLPEREKHVHDDTCYTEEKNLICTQEETTGHQHSEECYTRQQGEWICTQEEHEHSEFCYDEAGNLVCGLEPHQHGDQCYAWDEALTCGQEETTGHTHSGDCYETEKTLTCQELELHSHDGPCYEDGELVCTVPALEEHVHNEECFKEAEEQTAEDQKEPEQYQTDLSGNASEKQDPEDEKEPEGSQIETDGTASEKQDPEDKKEPEGSQTEMDGTASEEKDPEGQETETQDPGSQEETGETGGAKTFNYEDDQVQIQVKTAEKGVVPEDAELSVKPIVQQDVEALKADESVSENAVAEAEELNAKYEDVQKELEASVAEDDTKEIAGFLAYDISFLVDKENEETGETEKIEVEPDGNVEVAMKFADAYIPEIPEGIAEHKDTDKETSADDTAQTEKLAVDVVHMKEVKDKETGEIKLNAEVLDAHIDKTEDAKVSEVKFSADSFSAFTITWYQQRGNVSNEIEIKCCDTNGNDIDLVSLPSLELNSDNYESFSIGEINRTNYYSVSDRNGNEYHFKEARYVEAGKSVISEGKKIDIIQYNQVIILEENSVVPKEIIPIGGESPQYEIYFLYDGGSSKELETVETIDNNLYGIKMYMLDYAYDAGGIHSKLGGAYTNGKEATGLVESCLSENGYPIIKGEGNGDLSQWFSIDGTGEGARKVNHLFREDKYLENKTFYYSCFENYAYLRSDNNFNVYNALGTPVDVGTVNLETMMDTYQLPFLQRGNFFPYNDININYPSALYNLYDKDGNWLDKKDDRYKERLYKILPNTTTGEKVDFHFSMYLEAEFMQAKGGYYNGKAMKYEFTGDDDLWVFIDDQLVLDLGGVHDARSGEIDFSTGIVKNGDSIKSLSSLLDLSSDTLEDYSTHTLKMFYMERNGHNEYNTKGEKGNQGASNLRISFNLPTIPEDQIWVTKQLSNSNQDMYANTKFRFQVMAQQEDGKDENGNPKYSDTYESLTNATYFHNGDSVSFDGDGVFELKPGQTAIFPGLKVNRKYYVKELGVSEDEYDTVSINSATYANYDKNEVEGRVEYSYESSKELVSERKGVVFTNNCSTKNSRELQITKTLSSGTSSDPNSLFDIKVWLENTEGKLVEYEGDYYLSKMVDGIKKYFKYDSNGKVTDVGSEPTKCGSTNNGIMKIGPGYTVSITGLIAGTHFKVEEILNNEENEEYEEYDTPQIKLERDTFQSIDEVTDSSGEIKSSDAIELNQDAKVTVINTKKGEPSITKSYDWIITKKGTTINKGLEGAKFKLTSSSSGKNYTGTSGANGVIEWTDDQKNTVSVEAGEYVLEEIEAPANYLLSDKKWKISLDAKGIEIKDMSSNEVVSRNELEEDDIPVYEYTFLNECIYELPSTGGDGIYWYLVSGVMLMMASTLILYKNRRKGVIRR